MIDVYHLGADVLKDYTSQIYQIALTLINEFDKGPAYWDDVLRMWKELNEQHGVDDPYLFRFKKTQKRAVADEDAIQIGRVCLDHLRELHSELCAYSQMRKGKPCRTLKGISDRIQSIADTILAYAYMSGIDSLNDEIEELNTLENELRMTYLASEIPAKYRSSGPQNERAEKETMETFEFAPRKDITGIEHDDCSVSWSENEYYKNLTMRTNRSKNFDSWAEMQIFLEQLRLLAEDCQV